MDGEMVSRFHRHGSTFVGAILMSNRTTKQECLQRKLFGMTSTWAWHIMQIKAGMLLFLFEHEERKLYGVFEAASDGAMNIMPNAFLSSGNSFPAQVLFKRIWMCKPLSEDGFSDAIKDNYVAQKRFKFGLSYGQVYKLIQLFSLKRINVMQCQRPAIPNEIIEEFERYGGNKGMPKAEGTDSFPSAHTSNFHGHPEASTHRCDFEEQRCEALGTLPDYVPLVGIDTNAISSYFDCPSKDTSGNYSSESVEDDDLQGQPCLATQSEEGYPTFDSRLHSDTDQSRISVFSRLSKARKVCRVPKNQEAFHERAAQKTLNRFSLDHLARILSQKKEQLIETKKVPKQSSIHDDVEKFECKVVMEPNMTTFPGELERSNDAFDEDGIAEDIIVEESSELLILNSKRKSGMLSLSGENQMNVDAESGLDEDTSQEYKRRKLLRASASEEECGNVQGSLPEMIEVKTIIENNVRNNKTCEIASPNNFDTENNNNSASEASLGDVISDKREITTRSLNNHRKEVSNRNLRWFLQKSINTLSKESNMDHVNGRTKDASHMVGDVSHLLANNKHEDEETNGITGDEKMYCRL